MSLQAERLRSRLLAEGVPLLLIPTNPRLPGGLGFVGRVPVIRTLVREVRYLFSLLRLLSPRIAVVHHFSASGLFFFLHSAPLLILGRIAGRRVILNYRGGRAGYFLSSWAWLAVPLMRLASQVAVPSGFLREIFSGYGMTSVVLPNIAETDLFPFRERVPFSPRLLVTRNLEPMYNVECILRAFRMVQSRYPEAALGIVGSGSREAHLRQLVSEWRLRNVTFYGAVPNEQLPAIYERHDIYVNASSVDNFPGALVEAACSGLAIVTTAAGGIPGMLPDRKRAILVPLDDHVALADAVLECLRDQQLAGRLAGTARLWAEQFSWRNVFPRLLECYGMASKVQATAGAPVSLLEDNEARKGIGVS